MTKQIVIRRLQIVKSVRFSWTGLNLCDLLSAIYQFRPVFCKWTILFLILTLHYASNANAQLTNGMDADVVVGQPDFVTSTANTGGISARTSTNMAQMIAYGERLYVVQQAANHRVLVYNSIPRENFAQADFVLGQPDFVTAVQNFGGVSANGMDGVLAVLEVRSKLFVVDNNNHRVLVYNQVPTQTFQAAAFVLGQPNFAAETRNAGGGANPASGTFDDPIGIDSDGQILVISDRDNNRVQIWNSIPESTLAPADIVLGQHVLTTSTANNGGVSASSLNNPFRLALDGRRLIVTDRLNSRVLIWNSVPTRNFEPADVVLGQPDFTQALVNNGGVSARSLNLPRGVASDGARLYVADSGNNRVLVWEKIPTTNFTPADIVLGQPNFSQNGAAVGRNKMSAPLGVRAGLNRLFVADSGNNRGLIFNLASFDSKNLGPQFSEGKAVVGKVFIDWNGDGEQNG